MPNRVCLICSSIFKAKKSSTQKCCSLKCAGKYRTVRKPIIKICANCQCKYEGLPKTKYCSRACTRIMFGNKNRTEKLERTCLICNKPHLVSIFKKVRLETCSSECHKVFRKVFKCKYPIVCKKCDIGSCSSIITMNLDRLDRSEYHYCSLKCSNLARSQKAFEMRKSTGTKPELKFADLLKLHNIDYCVQYWINWKKGWKKWYDFYLPNIDTLIEVDGTYWHGKNLEDSMLNAQQTKTRENDKLKNQMAIDQNYKLIRIWEDELDNFDFETLKGNK